MKSRCFLLTLLLLFPQFSFAGFWSVCGDILRVSSAYARVPTSLIEKFWHKATVPNEFAQFDKKLMTQATETYLEKLKAGKEIEFYGVVELDAGFLNAVIDTPFDVENVLKGSSEKKKAFYRVIQRITDAKGHTPGDLKHLMATLYEVVYSDAVITKKWVDDGIDSAAKFHFQKIWEQRMATQNVIQNFRNLGLITDGSKFSRFKDFMHDPLVQTIVDVGLNYGLVTHSPVVYLKAPGQKFASWIKFPKSVEEKILLGDYEGAWKELPERLKSKVKLDVFYQSVRYGVNSVMPYLTAASITYLVYDRWLDWKKENPNRRDDIPPINAWPKPEKSQLRSVLQDVPDLSPGDLRSAYKTFGI